MCFQAGSVNYFFRISLCSSLLQIFDRDGSFYVSGNPYLLRICVCFKICQTVAGISRISQFHIFLGLVCVRRYCEFLTEADHVQQVAWYVSQLRNEDQIDLYSQFLSTLKHEADKRLALSLAVENSLPVQDILSQVVKRIHDNEVSFNCM